MHALERAGARSLVIPARKDNFCTVFQSLGSSKSPHLRPLRFFYSLIPQLLNPCLQKEANPGGPAGPCSAKGPFMGGTVSQLWQLFQRTHDWFVRPLPALSPLVSLSLSFHIRADKIYWCLCSTTDSGPSLFLIFWSPVPRGCWPCTHWRHTVLKHAGQGRAVGRADGPLYQSYPQSLC